MSQCGNPSRGNKLARQERCGLLSGYFDEVSWTQLVAWSDVTFLPISCNLRQLQLRQSQLQGTHTQRALLKYAVFSQVLLDTDYR